MSEEDNSFEAVDTSEGKKSSSCASCGIAEIDDIKLKDCDGCDLVRYCSDECRINHKSEHAEDCRERAAALREELLFRQPEGTHHGDCPICSLPLPLDRPSGLSTCCNKTICLGCVHANQNREKEMRLQPSCPFCRKPSPHTDKEIEKRMKKRIEANDPFALCHEGVNNYIKGYYSRSFAHFTKAAGLGNVEAHFKLSMMYRAGEGVEENWRKGMYHLEEAAIRGHPRARCHLGCVENDNDNVERAVKHWIIAATQGDDESIKALMDMFRRGLIIDRERIDQSRL